MGKKLGSCWRNHQRAPETPVTSSNIEQSTKELELIQALRNREEAAFQHVDRSIPFKDFYVWPGPLSPAKLWQRRWSKKRGWGFWKASMALKDGHLFELGFFESSPTVPKRGGKENTGMSHYHPMRQLKLMKKRMPPLNRNGFTHQATLTGHWALPPSHLGRTHPGTIAVV